jgi:hypothetical protein
MLKRRRRGSERSPAKVIRKNRRHVARKFGAFEDALPAIRQRIADGETQLSVCTSMAEALNTTPSALIRMLQRHRPEVVHCVPLQDRRRDVSKDHEGLLLGLIKTFSAAKAPLHVNELIDCAKQYAEHNDVDWRQWLTRFLWRHRAYIKRGVNKTITHARMSNKVIDDVESYIEHYESLREIFPVSDRAVMSLDEFLLSWTGATLGADRLQWIRVRQKAAQVPRSNRLGSICYVTSSLGTVVARFVVLRDDSALVLPVHHRLQRHEPTGTWYTTSKSGMMDNEIFSLIADKLIAMKSDGSDGIGEGLDRHLRFDGLGPHTQPPVLMRLMAARIRPVIIPPNSSSWTAVEDDLFFATLRGRSNKEAARYSARSSDQQKALLWAAIASGEAAAFQPNVIRQSYEDVGAVPWNPQLIRLRMGRALGHILPHSSNESSVVHEAAVAAQHVIETRELVTSAPIRYGRVNANRGARQFLDAETLVDNYSQKEEDVAKKKPRRWRRQRPRRQRVPRRMLSSRKKRARDQHSPSQSRRCIRRVDPRQVAPAVEHIASCANGRRIVRASMIRHGLDAASVRLSGCTRTTSLPRLW